MKLLILSWLRNKLLSYDCLGEPGKEMLRVSTVHPSGHDPSTAAVLSVINMNKTF